MAYYLLVMIVAISAFIASYMHDESAGTKTTISISIGTEERSTKEIKCSDSTHDIYYIKNEGKCL